MDTAGRKIFGKYKLDLQNEFRQVDQIKTEIDFKNFIYFRKIWTENGSWTS